MKKLLIFLFLLTTVSCLGQMSRLTLDFSPSFMDHSKVLIEKAGAGYTMTISTDKLSETCLLTASSMTEMYHFLEDYPSKKFTYDSLETVKRNEMARRGEHAIVLDGIGVSVYLEDPHGKKTFAANNPGKGTIDNELMRVLFRLMNASFKTPATITYVEQLEGYFPLGLGLKKLNENPLTYRLYGSVSSSEAEELYGFFAQLPTDKAIIFDMSNFEGMGTMFYSSFNTLCAKNPKIQWINCTERAKKQLTEAGINPLSIK